MGIQINGNTDVISANDGILSINKLDSIIDKNGSKGTSNQILTAGNGSELLWSNISTGTIDQIVRSTYSTYTTHTLSWGDTGLSASITPASTNSKIIIIVNQPVVVANRSGGIKLMKGVTELYNPSDSYFSASDPNGSPWVSSMASLYYVDTPASTSSVTYRTQGISSGTSSTFYSNCAAPSRIVENATSQMYLIEVA